ncbi:hypothetical protein SEA_MERCEDES_13 [Microbacterium phage Mercedes]|nr:hypothetical protein SEA_MERCEDES_13 [Microbacterium phage Mercedes]
MTGIKPSTHGIVVDHKESGTRYAISDRNYDEKVHRKVRDLRPGETVLGYRPKRREAVEAARKDQSGTGTTEQGEMAALKPSEPLADGQGKATQTEGANTGTQEKEGK